MGAGSRGAWGVGVLLACLLGSLAVGATSASASGDPPSDLATSSVRSPIAGDAFTFVMTDRYRDGNPANNTGGLTGDYRVTGYLPESDAYFHGGDFAGLTGNCDQQDPSDHGLARLKRMGFTAVWLTPPFVNRAVQGSSAGYHGYWFLDITRPDPHLGTEAEFAALMACARKLGMKVFLDVVVNHTADVITPQVGFTSYIPIEAKPYRTAAGKAFDPWAYARGTSFPALRPKVSFAYVPNVPAALAAAKVPAVLNEAIRYHNRGDIDWGSCVGRCEMDGDFAGLDDLMTEDWTVVQALAQAYGSWIAKYQVDGFRIDTAKHVDPAFFSRWLPLIDSAAVAAGKPGLPTFAEIWLESPVALADQMLDRQLPSVLDFPTQQAMRGFVTGRRTGGALALHFDEDDRYTSATTNAYGLATFLGNHDMGRIGYFLTTDTRAEGSALLERDLLAHDLLLLTRGVPIVMYGDEVGMTGSGDGRDRQARQDMFPTAVTAWQGQERIGGPPIGTGSSFAQTSEIQARLRTLNDLRSRYPALASGAQVTRYGQGGVFAVSRLDATQRREFVVAFNASDEPASVSVPTATPDTTWQSLTDDARFRSGPGGELALVLPARSTLVLRAEGQLPVPPAPQVSVSVDEDFASGTYLLTAQVPGSDLGTVTFVSRPTGSSQWTVLGADDARAYRFYLDPGRLGAGRRIQVAAILTDSLGQRAVSKPVNLTLKPLF